MSILERHQQQITFRIQYPRGKFEQITKAAGEYCGRIGTADVRKRLPQIQADLAPDNRRLAKLARASTDLLAEDRSALRGAGPTDELVQHRARRMSDHADRSRSCRRS